MTLTRRNVSRILLFLLILAALLFATGALFAQIATRSGGHIEANDVLPDMAFFTGGKLSIASKSADDVFAAGGDVSINGAQADHMVATGGDIIVTDAAFHDLIAAGVDLDFVSGTVADDVVAAGGDLNLQPDFRVSGSAVLTGGSVVIAAPITGELRASGGYVRLDSAVEQGANLAGDQIVIGPNARIGGDLRHRGRAVQIDPNAVVTGKIIELEPPARPDFERWGVKAAAAIAVFSIAFLIGMALLIVVIATVLPALMNSASAMIREKPLSTLGIGFLISASAPVVIGVLFATIFGVPLALLIAVLYAATAPLAITAFAYFLGMQIRRTMRKDAPLPGGFARALWSALAALGLVIAGFIPILGGLVWLVAYVIGTGAVMTRGGKALALKA